MAEFEITKDNTKEIERALQQQAFKALTECGLVAEGYAKVNLTMSGAVDSGNLRNSVSNKVVEEDGDIVCYIGTNVEYAPYIEYGTGQYYSGGRKTPWAYQDADGHWHKTKGMKARPFIRPAVADHVDTYRKIIEKELKN